MQIIPQKYASEGRAFETQEEAERFEKLFEAYEEYKRAYKTLGKALAQTQRTADGKLFGLGVWLDYFYVVAGWHGGPELRRIHFTGINFEWDAYEDRVVITQDGEKYPIHKLYSDHWKAKEALVKQHDEWIEQQRKSINEYRVGGVS